MDTMQHSVMETDGKTDGMTDVKTDGIVTIKLMDAMSTLYCYNVMHPLIPMRDGFVHKGPNIEALQHMRAAQMRDLTNSSAVTQVYLDRLVRPMNQGNVPPI